MWVGYTDWRYRRIDHWCILYLILVGLIMLHLSDADMLSALKYSAAVLVLGYLAWWMSLVGAGDVKLFFGLSFWHAGELLEFALLMSIIGAVIALAYLGVAQLRKRQAGQPEGIPYGIAIVLASVALHA